jgi:hypothetical protein
VKEMNTYYTAKDIEELAAKGTRQLVLSPGVFLTDFARETAQQLGFEVVRGETRPSPPAASGAPNKVTTTSDRYNKPSGCQHATSPMTAVSSQAANPIASVVDGDNSKTVSRLIDLMGKVVKRGG